MSPALKFSAMALIAVGLAACGPQTLTNEVTYAPPPPLALVALIDPSPSQASSEFRQLEDVVRSNASPGEAIVVMLIQPGFGTAYVVRSGDSLSSIAAAHGLTLAGLESANPQLGPVSGREWRLIHPGEQVMIPNGSPHAAAVLVSKAPAGPPPPLLLRLPRAPSNPTDYQRAQYQRTVAADNATNAQRVAQWHSDAAASLVPWQAQVASDLERASAGQSTAGSAPDATVLSASLIAATTTLQGLSGRRFLLLLGGGDLGPGKFSAGGLNGVNVVVANVGDANAAAAWTSAAQGAGALSVKALDPSLTQLQLTQIVDQ